MPCDESVTFAVPMRLTPGDCGEYARRKTKVCTHTHQEALRPVANWPRYGPGVSDTRPVSQSTATPTRPVPPCTVMWPPDELPSGA
jgi:hypothetical protein